MTFNWGKAGAKYEVRPSGRDFCPVTSCLAPFLHLAQETFEVAANQLGASGGGESVQRFERQPSGGRRRVKSVQQLLDECLRFVKYNNIRMGAENLFDKRVPLRGGPPKNARGCGQAEASASSRQRRRVSGFNSASNSRRTRSILS